MFKNYTIAGILMSLLLMPHLAMGYSYSNDFYPFPQREELSNSTNKHILLSPDDIKALKALAHRPKPQTDEKSLYLLSERLEDYRYTGMAIRDEEGAIKADITEKEGCHAASLSKLWAWNKMTYLIPLHFLARPEDKTVTLSLMLCGDVIAQKTYDEHIWLNAAYRTDLPLSVLSIPNMMINAFLPKVEIPKTRYVFNKKEVSPEEYERLYSAMQSSKKENASNDKRHLMTQGKTTVSSSRKTPNASSPYTVKEIEFSSH